MSLHLNLLEAVGVVRGVDVVKRHVGQKECQLIDSIRVELMDKQIAIRIGRQEGRRDDVPAELVGNRKADMCC